MKTWNIFLLEDDSVDKLLITDCLSTIQVNLIHANSVSSAKELLDNLTIKLDCCLLDRNIPGGTGLDIIQHPALHTVPCIMLTGYQDNELAVHAIQIGLEDYISKSDLNSALLIRAIRYAIERNHIKISLAESNRLLEELIVQDPLTGVINRRGLEELLQRLLQRNKNFDENHGIILIDLDNFKSINDNYGYDAGDKALVLVANILKLSARPLDYVVRVGGDEFLILVINVELEQCLAIAERIKDSLAQTPVILKDNELHITASIGVSSLNACKTVEELLQSTQDALHKSKNLGKNRVNT
jgi:diguanylate cyclase (GGDEF)-like protein